MIINRILYINLAIIGLMLFYANLVSGSSSGSGPSCASDIGTCGYCSWGSADGGFTRGAGFYLGGSAKAWCAGVSWNADAVCWDSHCYDSSGIDIGFVNQNGCWEFSYPTKVQCCIDDDCPGCQSCSPTTHTCVPVVTLIDSCMGPYIPLPPQTSPFPGSSDTCCGNEMGECPYHAPQGMSYGSYWCESISNYCWDPACSNCEPHPCGPELGTYNCCRPDQCMSCDGNCYDNWGPIPDFGCSDTGHCYLNDLGHPGWHTYNKCNANENCIGNVCVLNCVVMSRTVGFDSPFPAMASDSACCLNNDDCVYESTCYVDGSVKANAYCKNGNWVGGDESNAVCTAIVAAGSWRTEVPARCCGDDGGVEYDNDCYTAIGLMGNDGATFGIAVAYQSIQAKISSKLITTKGGTNHKIGLVTNPAHPLASKITVQTSTGLRYIRKLS